MSYPIELIDRTILLSGEITEELCFNFVKMFLELQKSDDPINVVIATSIGGDYSAGLSAMDVMLGSQNYISTYCLGEVSSTSAMMWVCGDDRYVSKHSCLMFHRGVNNFGEDSTESVLKVTEVIQKMDEQTYQLLSNKSKKPPGFYRDKLSKDFFVFADLALELELATHLGTPS